MSYQELGEARILKRFNGRTFAAPARKEIVQDVKSDSWQTIDQAAARFLLHTKQQSVTAQ